MIIAISGTPGTGKTIVSKLLAKKLNYKYLDLNKFIKKSKIYSSYDKKRKCFMVNIKKLNKLIIKKIKVFKKNPGKYKGLIIDSHLSHYIPERHIDLCIITKTQLSVLNKRLKKRGYSKQKIKDNLDAEIFEICLTEAQELGHRIIEVDTTKKLNINNLINKIKNKNIN